MKQAMIQRICEQLQSMGIPFQIGGAADITLSAEFLDAGWSTGSKKISYQASVYLDEHKQTVYMWEMTTETGQGFSFGGSSESSFQSGTNLYRKVKLLQYGLDGRAYEINLDLGAIPKTVKETSKGYGWDFKTVFSKEKAEFPAGMAPSPYTPQTPPQAARRFCTQCGKPLKEQARFCQHCGKPV